MISQATLAILLVFAVAIHRSNAQYNIPPGVLSEFRGALGAVVNIFSQVWFDHRDKDDVISAIALEDNDEPNNEGLELNILSNNAAPEIERTQEQTISKHSQKNNRLLLQADSVGDTDLLPVTTRPLPGDGVAIRYETFNLGKHQEYNLEEDDFDNEDQDYPDDDVLRRFRRQIRGGGTANNPNLAGSGEGEHVILELFLSGDVGNRGNLPPILNYLNSVYTAADLPDFVRVDLTYTEFDPATNATLVRYEVVFSTPVGPDDVDDVAAVTRDIVTQDTEIPVGNVTTAFIANTTNLVLPVTVDGEQEIKIPLFANLEDVCHLYKESSACNGGDCFDSNGTPKCRCPEDLVGEFCQWPRHFTNEERNILVILLPVIAGICGVALISCCCWALLARRANRGESETSSVISDVSVPQSFFVVPGPHFMRGPPQDWRLINGPPSTTESEPSLHRAPYHPPRPPSAIESRSSRRSGRSDSTWHSSEVTKYTNYGIPRPLLRKKPHKLYTNSD